MILQRKFGNLEIFIDNTKLFLEQNISFSNQSKWEFLKNEIRKKCVFFSKVLAQKSHKQDADFLCKITKLEQDIDNEEKFEEYDKPRSESCEDVKFQKV